MTSISAPERFSRGAAAYAETMAPSLRPVAAEVVRRAALAPGERVLDVGTGTGIAAAAAVGDGRDVLGIDAAEGMLRVARAEVPAARFELMDFGRLALADATVDVVLAVHCLLFADDQVAVLREWRRVTRPGGRLSLSVPGPGTLTPSALYRQIYERHGIDTTDRYPTLDRLASAVADGGWEVLDATADPGSAIQLRDAAAFARWRSITASGGATAHYSEEEQARLTAEMLEATPREPDGTLRIPFGTLYITARAPA